MKHKKQNVIIKIGEKMEKVINIKYFTDIDKVERISVGNWIDLRSAEDVDIPVGEYIRTILFEKIYVRRNNCYCQSA